MSEYKFEYLDEKESDYIQTVVDPYNLSLGNDSKHAIYRKTQILIGLYCD